jgi:hypothetical protein
MCLGVKVKAKPDGGLLARAWPIIKRFQWTIGNSPLDAALDRLMMYAESLAYGGEGRVFAISQKHSRPLDMACRLRSRPRYLPQAPQILLSDCQFQYPTPRRHDRSPRSVNHLRGHEMGIRRQNSKHAIGFMESVV